MTAPAGGPVDGPFPLPHRPRTVSIAVVVLLVGALPWVVLHLDNVAESTAARIPGRRRDSGASGALLVTFGCLWLVLRVRAGRAGRMRTSSP